MFGTIHPDEMEDILHAHHVGHLACIANDLPYLVPITYVYDGGLVYAHTVPGTKVDALRTRPVASFCVVEHREPNVWRSVILECSYEELDASPARDRALDLLDAVVPNALPDRDGIVFRLRPARKSGRWLRLAE